MRLEEDGHGKDMRGDVEGFWNEVEKTWMEWQLESLYLAQDGAD
jgi:hypothetical protein